jgi:hypothetical protein
MYQTEHQRRMVFESCQRAWDNMTPDDDYSGDDNERDETEDTEEVKS